MLVAFMHRHIATAMACVWSRISSPRKQKNFKLNIIPYAYLLNTFESIYHNNWFKYCCAAHACVVCARANSLHGEIYSHIYCTTRTSHTPLLGFSFHFIIIIINKCTREHIYCVRVAQFQMKCDGRRGAAQSSLV